MFIYWSYVYSIVFIRSIKIYFQRPHLVEIHCDCNDPTQVMQLDIQYGFNLSLKYELLVEILLYGSLCALGETSRALRVGQS